MGGLAAMAWFARLAAMLSAVRGLFITVLVVTMLACLVGAFVPQIPPGSANGLPYAVLVPTAFVSGIVIASVTVLVIFRAMLTSSQRHTSWVKSLTSPNGRIFFFILLLLWTGGMFLLPTIAQAWQPALNGAPSTAEGGLALIGLLAGAFIFLGFIWAVIGE